MIDSPSKDLKEALFQLSRLKKERPALTGPADFFSDVLPGLFEGESKDQPPAISPEQAQVKLSAGVPLLRGESVNVDLAAFRRRWLHVARAMERHQDAAAGKTLANVVHENRWNPQDVIAAVLASPSQLFHSWAEEWGLDSGLIGTVVRLSLFRSFANLQVQLLSLRSDSVWQRGYC